MSPSATPASWKRLGELLIRRRVELDPRYQNRSTFSTERGLDYRLAYDIEEARRTNFRKGTLAGIANAYAVTPDSLLAVLRDAHAQLEPAGFAASQSPATPGTSASSASTDGHADGDVGIEHVIRLLLGALDPSRPELQAALRRLLLGADGDGQFAPAPEGTVDALIRLLIEMLDPSRPKLQIALRAITLLEDGNGHYQPLPQRAELLLILLDRHLGSGAVPAAERRNGSIALVPTA